MREVVVVGALRTPYTLGGTGLLAHARPDEVLAALIKDLLELHPSVDREVIADVLIGCAHQSSSRGSTSAVS